MRFGVSIEMSTSYRLATQHFSNTFYYEAPVTEEATSTLNDLVDDLVAIMKAAHSNQVTFTRARLWSQIGTPSQNQMLIDRALSGVGTGATSFAADKERAFLIRFRAGVDTKGRPVYLRKWLHLDVGAINATNMTTAAVQQTAQLPAGILTGLVNLGESFKTIPVGLGPDTWDLVAKNGRQITGPTEAHKFYEHHQLGDEWRGV